MGFVVDSEEMGNAARGREQGWAGSISGRSEEFGAQWALRREWGRLEEAIFASLVFEFGFVRVRN